MKHFIVYLSNGVIVRKGACSPGDFDLQAADGESIVEGDVADTHNYRIIDGVVVHDPRPTDAHVRSANGDWVLPPPTIPTVVTMRQARLALHGAGLLGLVDAAVKAIPGPAGEAARIEWEYARTVERGSALVAHMAAEIPLTEGQLDALFTAADAL